MNMRTRKRQQIRLQAASSRLGLRGKLLRFYGGARWSRRQVLMWGRQNGKATIKALVLNRIHWIGSDTPFKRTYHGTDEQGRVRVVDTYYPVDRIPGTTDNPGIA